MVHSIKEPLLLDELSTLPILAVSISQLTFGFQTHSP